MLTPAELDSAATFYASPAGRKAHIAVIEAEKAAGAAMDEVAIRFNEGVGPTFTHYFLYDADVFFARQSFEIASADVQGIRHVLEKPRADDPTTDWCVMLRGYGDSGEEASNAYADLGARRSRAVRHLLIDYGLDESKIRSLPGDIRYPIYPTGDPRSSRVEIEQFPCFRP